MNASEVGGKVSTQWNKTPEREDAPHAVLFVCCRNSPLRSEQSYCAFLASTYGSGLAGLSGLTDRRSERPLREVGVFRYVQDFLYQGEKSGNTTAGTRREVSLF